MPRAVVFDLGDTVLEEKSYNISSGLEKISAYLSPRTSSIELADSIAQGQEGNREFQIALWIEDNMRSQSGSMSAHDIELLLWKSTVELVPKPGISQVLEFLVGNGIRVAAISNAIFSSNCMRYELTKHNLDSHFEFVISSADHGLRKPDATIFARASRILGIESCEIWYIGDRWDADVAGATKAGMTAIWFGGQSGAKDPDINFIALENWANFENIWREHG